MILYPVPPELQGLTQIEEMLIAHAIPIMRVYIKSGEQTQGKKKHILVHSINRILNFEIVLV